KPAQDEALKSKVEEFCKDKMYQISKSASSKEQRGEAFGKLKEELLASFAEEVEDKTKSLAKKYFDDLQWEVVRNMILDDR
ncbi:hypothetical protein ABTM81_20500, partial [Acinetobacter baumannii]